MPPMPTFLKLALAVLGAVSAFAQLPANSLGSLPVLTPNAHNRMVSPENPTGEKGKGAMSIPNPADPDLAFSNAAVDLGQGWKVRPFVKVKPHSTFTIMDVNGPGIIQHIWMAPPLTFRETGGPACCASTGTASRSPSIEIPMTDFFAIGHDKFARVNSAGRGRGPDVVDELLLADAVPQEGTHHLHKRLGQGTGAAGLPDRLCRRLRCPRTPAISMRSGGGPSPTAAHPDYTILEAKGEGRYVGTFLAWTQLSDGWFGEGEVKFYIDGDGKFPTIAAPAPRTTSVATTASRRPTRPRTWAARSTTKVRTGPPKWSLYRWHILDPVNFHKELRMTIQALGWWPNGRYQPLADDVASVAYWYQTEPHMAFPAFPPLPQRWPR